MPKVTRWSIKPGVWPLALMVMALLWAAPPCAAGLGEEVVKVLEGPIKQPYKGDLEGMIKRRIIRALVAYSKTDYFLDGATARGITYEALKQFEQQLNQELKRRHLKIHVIMIPVPRDKLIPYLAEGRGDIAAAMLTITSQRRKMVAFSHPFADQVREVVVTGDGAPPLKSLDDLSGRSVYVRKSSSYYASLKNLNERLKARGRPPVKIALANELLETEDILELANAGVVRITVADGYLADFWKQIFGGIQVHQDLVLRNGAGIAWAVRKDSPQLKAALNRFVKKHRAGTLLGNILIKRYLKDTRWARKVLSRDSVERFKRTTSFFRKYAAKYSFDWLMITALAYQESGLDQSKRSPAGAVGVMQLLPSTAAGPPVHIPDIEKMESNIHAGVKYLRFIYDRYFSDARMSDLNKVLMTFASYNAGPARVAGLQRKASGMGLNPTVWFQNVEVAAAKEIGRETVQYVSNIFKYYLAYKLIAEEQAEREATKVEVAR